MRDMAGMNRDFWVTDLLSTIWNIWRSWHLRVTVVLITNNKSVGQPRVIRRRKLSREKILDGTRGVKT